MFFKTLQNKFDRSVIGILLMFLGLGLFPISDALIKHLLGSYTVHQTIFLRALSRLLPLLAVTFYKTHSFSLLTTKKPIPHLIRLCVSIIGTYSFIYACSITSLTSLYVLSYTSPLFIIIFSSLVLREKIEPSCWFAVACGFIGILVATQPKESNLFAYGAIIILLGALCSALNKVLMRRLTVTEDSLTISMYPNITILLISIPFLIGNWIAMPIKDWILFSGIGVISALAQYCVAQALRLTEASRLAPIDYSTLLWVILIDYFHWETVPSLYTLIGAIIIIFSTGYILYRTKRTGAAEKSP